MTSFSRVVRASLSVASLLVLSVSAFAQPGAGKTGLHSSSAVADLEGSIEDSQGRPIAGAVVSVVGATALFAVSDEQGRFAFRGLPPGTYLLRSHSQGYVAAKSRIVHLAAGGRSSSRLTLSTRAEDTSKTDVLAASVAPPEAPSPTAVEAPEHDELAWRLRRAKRSVLRDVEGVTALVEPEQVPGGWPWGGLGKAVGESARYASDFFSDLMLSGELNLLTTSTFERPQDLFTMGGDAPHGVAYVAIAVPAASGEWTLRGTMTQGDLASWMLAGAYVRRAPGAHQFEGGFSYSMQRYLGGNGQALAAIADGSRNVGAVYGSDVWLASPRVQIDYGARYARYDYLGDPHLVSPRGGIAFRPALGDSLVVRVAASHRELAPGAQEFLPRATGLSLPPERTFSPVSQDGFRAERAQHAEVSAERAWPGGVLVGVRGFHQRVFDQGVTVFGAALPSADTEIGHYRVGSAGDVTATGWGLRVARRLGEDLTATVDYRMADAQWVRPSPHAAALAFVGASARARDERLQDVTARVDGTLPATSTRLLVFYRVSNGFSSHTAVATSREVASRFNVQVNQALPFLKLTNTQFEMLVAVSNVFHDQAPEGSMYDELLVVRPPIRVVGGVSVRF